MVSMSDEIKKRIMSIIDAYDVMVKHDYGDVIVLYNSDEAKEVVAELLSLAYENCCKLTIEADNHLTRIVFDEIEL